MGKSDRTRKNVLAALGCAVAAGVLFAGVSRAAVALPDLESPKAPATGPAWLGKVDIQVRKNGKGIGEAAMAEAGTGAYEEGGTAEAQTDGQKSGQENGQIINEQTINEQIKGQEKEDGREQAGAAGAFAAAQGEIAGAVVTDVSAVVREAMPCVVSITNEYTSYDAWYGGEYDDKANGSGIIVAQNDNEIMIVTNYHVVEKNKNLYVQFADDGKAAAYVKGQSPDNDLAIVSVFLEDVPEGTLANVSTATLGDSDSLKVGEPAIAIGDSLGCGQSVTTGVISALNRGISGNETDTKPSYFIQTDAAINPGNSGGALLNVKGEVIGINSSKIADYVIEGMGYAIPISTAKPIMEELMTKETRRRVPDDKRAFLGISGTEVTDEAAERYEMPAGVYVTSVFKDTAAGKAGLFKGDIIVSIDGEKMTSMDQIQRMLEFYAAGTKADVVVMRQSNGEYRQRTIAVMLGAKEE